MYVTIVHGCVSTSDGTRANAMVNCSPSVIWAKKMMMLATRSVRTHFVIASRHSVRQHRFGHLSESAEGDFADRLMEFRLVGIARRDALHKAVELRLHVRRRRTGCARSSGRCEHSNLLVHLGSVG